MKYEKIVNDLAQEVFDAIAPRVTPEDMERVRQAYLLAKEAHAPQRRKSGEPYILHPISVALIVAKELQLDANTVITAFLHDVVEDTQYTVEDIRQRFGNDVAGLVNVVTKQKKETYHTTKQVDNYQQILASLHYDIRAVMVKISDRLHNMRTLQSMRPDKQMKIAGETDCFYAPLANRLGLFEVKSDLENLSFKYRCELEYGDIAQWLEQDEAQNRERLQNFCKDVRGTLRDHGIQCEVKTFWRRPYSIWRRMKQSNLDFWHLPNRYYIRITFWEDTLDDPLTDKETCLKIYNLLTRDFRERPGSFINQIEQPKENSYQCLRMMLLSPGGIWEDVQICSANMVKASQVGCINEIGNNIGNWVKRFRKVLEDIVSQGNEAFFLEHISSSLYYDDITVFSPNGDSFILPKDSTVLDYAFKQGDNIGAHAHYAYVNGILCSVKTVLLALFYNAVAALDIGIGKLELDGNLGGDIQVAYLLGVKDLHHDHIGIGKAAVIDDVVAQFAVADVGGEHVLQRMQGGIADQVVRVRAAMTQIVGRHISIHAADIDAGKQDIVVDGEAGNAGDVIHKKGTSL